MIYDLSQPLYNDGPHYPSHPADSLVFHSHAAIQQDTVEQVQLMTHSGSHVDAPFHFLPELPSISEMPLSHFYGPCIAVDLRPLKPCHPIGADDLRPHESLLTEGVFVLLKTGWGDRRGNTKEFLTEWPYVNGEGARYLVERGVKGIGIDTLSTGGYGDKHIVGNAHRELLRHHKLLMEDIHIPDALLDGRRRFFAAFPILVANASGAWVRAIVWDKGDLDGDRPAPELRTAIPAELTGLLALERKASTERHHA